MKRRRTRKEFDKFPMPAVEKEAAIDDAKNMEYMSKFRDFHVRTVFYLALLGMTEEQMAVVLDISMSTFSAWKRKHPTFLESIKKGKEQADSQVVYSLYQAAIGYEHESEQIFCSKEKIYGTNDDGKTVLLKEVPKIIRAPFIKKYPPNVKAAIKWLETRQPAQWSEKVDARKHPGTQNYQFNFNGLSLEELKLLQKIGGQRAPIEDVAYIPSSQIEL